jgi:tetratricopeptide (TPR) repeat protein
MDMKSDHQQPGSKMMEWLAMPSYKLKIILCGSSLSGKSKLMKQCVKNSFQTDYKRTTGVDILTKDVILQNGEVATLSIWDISDVPRFERIRRTFYKGASGAIIVVNLQIPGDWECARTWIGEIHQKLGNIPMFLLGSGTGVANRGRNSLNDETLLKEQLDCMQLPYHAEDELDTAITGLTEHMMGLKARLAKQDVLHVVDAQATIDDDESVRWFRAAIKHVDRDELPQAIEAMTKARNFNPLWATPWYFLACFHDHEGAEDEAMACCIKAQELDPKLAVAWQVEAAIHVKKGHLDNAIWSCKKALDLDPDLAVAWKTLGRAYLQKGMQADADRSFARAAAIEKHEATLS